MDKESGQKVLPILPQDAGRSSKLKRTCIGLLYEWWMWEFLAMVVSIGAIIALIVVLKDADQQQQQPWMIGNTQLTLNTVISIISTIIRASLLVMVSGALNQSPWNWFAQREHGHNNWSGQPLKDLDTFGGAANSSLASLKLLYRTKFRCISSLYHMN